MRKRKPRYHGHRFPPQIISYAIWLYHRFTLSFRDVEDLLAERGVEVSYESIRRWCLKFGPRYQRALKRREGRLGDTWFADEMFIKSEVCSTICGAPLTKMGTLSIFSFSAVATLVPPSAFSVRP